MNPMAAGSWQTMRSFRGGDRDAGVPAHVDIRERDAEQAEDQSRQAIGEFRRAKQPAGGRGQELNERPSQVIAAAFVGRQPAFQNKLNASCRVVLVDRERARAESSQAGV